jgi:hypothetical protein
VALHRRLASVVVVAGLAGACPGAAAVTQPVAPPRAAAVPVVVDLPPILKPVYTTPKQPRKRTLFDGSRMLFPGHRVVAFYGAPHAPGLGVLGAGSPDDMWPQLRRQAKPYTTHKNDALPAYELITFIATGSRGNQGNFSSRLPDSVISRYAHAAKRHHGLLILDIQPGRGNFLPDARTLAPWLRLPYVELAIDPEWKLYGDEMPLSRIGHTDAGTVNRVSRWLNHLTRVNGLPQKMLLVHEFTDDMVRNKNRVVERKHVATVFNVDGFGSRGAKVGKYLDFAAHTDFPLGFKVFYDADIGMMSPADVLRLRPRPVIVEYE